MSERQPAKSFDHCHNCPNMGRIKKVLAKLGGLPELAEGCEGSVKVSHGEIQTYVRRSGDPDPDKIGFKWNTLVGDAYYGGEERYSRTDWMTEHVCGRDEIAPREGEVPYGLRGEYVRTNKDGKRVAAFIKGDEKELDEHRGTLAIMDLLHATTEMEDAEDAGDTEGANLALNKINQYGFSKPISAGRRGSGRR